MQILLISVYITLHINEKSSLSMKCPVYEMSYFEPFSGVSKTFSKFFLLKFHESVRRLEILE